MDATVDTTQNNSSPVVGMNGSPTEQATANIPQDQSVSPPAPQGPQATSNIPQPTASKPQGYEPHNIWGAIFKALGGGDKTQYRVAGPGEVDAQGKPIPEGTTVTTQVAPTKGQLGKAILASVIYGLSAGEKQRGPGAGLRSLAAGGEATLNQGLAVDERARQNAQTDFANRQQAQLRQAQIFASNAEAAHNIREAERLQGETFQGMIDRDSASLSDVDPADIVAHNVPQDQALADLKSGKYGATTHNVYVTGYAEKKDANGKVVTDPSTGSPVLEGLVTITEDKPVSLTKEDVGRYQQYGVPGFSGVVPSDGATVPASQKRGWDQMVHSVENAHGIAQKIGVPEEHFQKASQQPGAAKAFQLFSRYSTGDPFADLQKMEAAQGSNTTTMSPNQTKTPVPMFGQQTMSILRDAFGGDQARQYHDQLMAQAEAQKTAAQEQAKRIPLTPQQATDSQARINDLFTTTYGTKVPLKPEYQLKAGASQYDVDQITKSIQDQQTAKKAQAEIANAYVSNLKDKYDVADKSTKLLMEDGQDPVTGQKLTLDNAPPEMLVDAKTGNPIPLKMLTTLKPTMQESNRADFAKSAINSMNSLNALIEQGKAKVGPFTGRVDQMMAKAGLGDKYEQELLNYTTFAQSAATGAHVGGRFNVPIMNKMNTVINPAMNVDQLQGAMNATKEVMQHYVDQGGRITVGDYKSLPLADRFRMKGIDVPPAATSVVPNKKTGKLHFTDGVHDLGEVPE